MNSWTVRGSLILLTALVLVGGLYPMRSVAESPMDGHTARVSLSGLGFRLGVCHYQGEYYMTQDYYPWWLFWNGGYPFSRLIKWNPETGQITRIAEDYSISSVMITEGEIFYIRGFALGGRHEVIRVSLDGRQKNVIVPADVDIYRLVSAYKGRLYGAIFGGGEKDILSFDRDGTLSKTGIRTVRHDDLIPLSSDGFLYRTGEQKHWMKYDTENDTQQVLKLPSTQNILVADGDLMLIEEEIPKAAQTDDRIFRYVVWNESDKSQVVLPITLPYEKTLASTASISSNDLVLVVSSHETADKDGVTHETYDLYHWSISRQEWTALGEMPTSRPACVVNGQLFSEVWSSGMKDAPKTFPIFHARLNDFANSQQWIR